MNNTKARYEALRAIKQEPSEWEVTLGEKQTQKIENHEQIQSLEFIGSIPQMKMSFCINQPKRARRILRKLIEKNGENCPVITGQGWSRSTDGYTYVVKRASDLLRIASLKHEVAA